MARIATLADKVAVEREMPWEQRLAARSLYEQLTTTASRFPDRPAISFQLRSGPRDKRLTLTWAETRAQVTQAANLFRRLGIGPTDTVAYVLPNAVETAVVLLAGATAGVVAPVNPLLSVEHMAEILRECGARAVVTLKPFPKTDLAQKVADAVALAPAVETVLEVDLARGLAPPLAWIVPLIRPKLVARHRARVLDLAREMAKENAAALDFTETLDDRVCTAFHTGGTTGMPKVARHRARGILYNGWCGQFYMFTEADVLMCPLPLFHVFAAYPILMSCLVSGAEMVMPTPQGYRGDGVMDSFWKLIERYRVSFLITVPTAVSALMQRKVDADVSTLRLGISGSAPMPVELFHRFEEATGVRVLEGYGLTEATCLVAINPPFGERKVGSVGLPFAYTEVAILKCDADGRILATCATDEIGEICAKNPGVNAEVYADPARNRGMIAEGGYLRTGDLGRLDADGYLWITGRAKDLIIRGGHNIDPAAIEEALMAHPAVAFVGAIGQPDARSGELPAAYVELCAGAAATVGGAARPRPRPHRRARGAAEAPRDRAGAAEDRGRQGVQARPPAPGHRPGLRRRARRGRLGGAGRRRRRGPPPRARRRARRRTGRARRRGRAALGGFTVPWRWRDA